jgi:hypothetical protein
MMRVINSPSATVGGGSSAGTDNEEGEFDEEKSCSPLSLLGFGGMRSIKKKDEDDLLYDVESPSKTRRPFCSRSFDQENENEEFDGGKCFMKKTRGISLDYQSSNSKTKTDSECTSLSSVSTPKIHKIPKKKTKNAGNILIFNFQQTEKIVFYFYLFFYYSQRIWPFFSSGGVRSQNLFWILNIHCHPFKPLE